MDKALQKTLPTALTSYDFLKFAALTLMIIDHMGYYFFQDLEWMRALGRLSAPIWLFLVGYARSRDFSARMWIAIGLMHLTAFITGDFILPLTILATILVCRALIDPVMAQVKRRPYLLYPLFAVLFFSQLFTDMALEYGSLAMGFVIFGYAVRHKEDDPYLKSQLFTIAMTCVTLHGLLQIYYYFGTYFDQFHKIAVMAGLTGVCLALMRFKPVEYPELTARIPRPLTTLVQFFGRHSLLLYVAHVALFRFIMLWADVPGYTLFTLHIKDWTYSF